MLYPKLVDIEWIPPKQPIPSVSIMLFGGRTPNEISSQIIWVFVRLCLEFVLGAWVRRRQTKTLVDRYCVRSTEKPTTLWWLRDVSTVVWIRCMNGLGESTSSHRVTELLWRSTGEGRLNRSADRNSFWRASIHAANKVNTFCMYRFCRHTVAWVRVQRASR